MAAAERIQETKLASKPEFWSDAHYKYPHYALNSMIITDRGLEWEYMGETLAAEIAKCPRKPLNRVTACSQERGSEQESDRPTLRLMTCAK
jgi:hypothetical protein